MGTNDGLIWIQDSNVGIITKPSKRLIIFNYILIKHYINDAFIKKFSVILETAKVSILSKEMLVQEVGIDVV